MRCAKCGCQEDRVIDSRASREGITIRRRRECLQCGNRFTTYEQIELEGPVVIKQDGRSEELSREKVVEGLRQACLKRPVSAKAIDELADHVLAEIAEKYDREVPSMAIGERLIEGLRELDAVAYIRFASVYRRFDDPSQFIQEVKKLQGAL